MHSIVLRHSVVLAALSILQQAGAASKRLPVLNHPLADMTTIQAAPIQINLNRTFGTEPIDDQVVRFTSQFSSDGLPMVLDFALFSHRAPATRTNFLNYVNGGDFTDSFVHRSVPGFVLQGGGFRLGEAGLEEVPTDAPVVNEFGISNTLGTIAMAKQGGDPNSATSQWFISLGPNSDILDPQNGGFTVFGQITKATLPNAQIFNDDYYFPIYGFDSPFDELPLFFQYQGANPLNFVISFPSVTLEPLPPGQAGESANLTYSVISNSNPGLAAPTINAETLTVNPVSGQTGSTTLTIRATDSVGNTVDDTFIVTVASTDTYTTWASRTTFPNNQNAASQNPDTDALNNLQEFAFFGDPSVSSQAQVPVAGGTGTAPGSRFLTLTFPVRKFTSGLSYVVEANNSLDHPWTPVWSSADGFSHALVVSATPLADRTRVTIKDNCAIGSIPHRFMRVKVVQN